MPLNLIKKYNQLLDLVGLNETQRKKSLMGIFNQDIAKHPNFNFRSKKITPTPADGIIKMETLFDHLTTILVDKKTRKREFDMNRSLRLHWVKFHIEEQKQHEMLLFSVQEPEGYRTYIYDKVEKYVIVLEPLKNKNEYYLLSAHQLTGKDAKRDKMIKKYKRKLDEVL
jgi:hypothetical protein